MSGIGARQQVSKELMNALQMALTDDVGLQALPEEMKYLAC